LFYFIMCEDPHEYNFIEIAFGWGDRSHMTSHYTWGFVTTLHDFGTALGRPLDSFSWALTISWSWLLACVQSGPKFPNATLFIPISAYVYAELWSVITSYSRVQ
jgi:hypothetical protein